MPWQGDGLRARGELAAELADQLVVQCLAEVAGAGIDTEDLDLPEVIRLLVEQRDEARRRVVEDFARWQIEVPPDFRGHAERLYPGQGARLFPEDG